MRKNRMLRLASALAICVLLTTSVISGTFAKYTTATTAEDTARVAKWGVTFANTTGLFAESYKDTAITGSSATVKVGTTDVKKLVAPGTNGTGLGITATGSPEVSYNVTIKLDDNASMPTLKYTKSGGTTTSYAPVKFSVYNGSSKLVENKTLDELKGIFSGNNAIYTYDVATRKYYFDVDLDGTISDTEKNAGVAACPNIQIMWEWAYEDSDNTKKALYDELDTILGNAAAGTSATIYSDGSISDINTDVSLPWTMTATQID